ncbi:MAG: cbb3-type cytochrome c oxidase subunit I [Nitrospira sp.]|nr:MAG: cbb3-type cytochrome c oxidase subunit I [Nitrospira sp.]
MGRLTARPLIFLITGFGWLLLSALLGLAILIGLIHGTPLPSWLRLVHVHAILIGGILQLTIGGLCASLSHSSHGDETPSKSHLGLFVILNASTVGLLVGFGLGDMRIVGAAGVVILGAVASLAPVAWQFSRQSPAHPANPSWLYRFSLIALLGGLAIGIAMAFRVMPEFYAHARLLHLHLILMGFVTLAMIGATQRLLPIILQTELYSPKLARLVSILLPAGFATLIGGFITSSLKLELAIGGLLVLSIGLYAYNLLRTWTSSGQPGNAASDHLLVATFFLVIMMVMGVLVGANFLPQLPVLPFGSLHLAAYTHMALIGFILQTVVGVLSYGIPEILATSRIASRKKQGPYREQLAAMMDRWRAIQLAGLSLGTMGFGVLAAMTWNFPLNSLPMQIATWVTVGLLLSSLALFTAKLAWVFGVRPQE